MYEGEFEIFFATVRKQGEGGREITVDKKVGDFMGLEEGDIIKVMIKKVADKKEYSNKKEEIEE